MFMLEGDLAGGVLGDGVAMGHSEKVARRHNNLTTNGQERMFYFIC